MAPGPRQAGAHVPHDSVLCKVTFRKYLKWEETGAASWEADEPLFKNPRSELV